MKEEKLIKGPITYGADPEVFLINKYTMELVSAIEVIKGTKEKPLKVQEGYLLSHDNVAAEFTIRPSLTLKEFQANMERGIWCLNSVLPDNLELSIESSTYFDETQLQSSEAKKFGCSPDFNAWKESKNKVPNASKSNLRSAGAHVHIGFTNNAENFDRIEKMDVVIRFIKSLDIFLGVESVLLDKDTQRRKLYGQAGCFRIRPFGLEYRSLGNFWIKNPKGIRWVYNGIKKAINFVNNFEEITIEDESIIQNCINTYDKVTAGYLLDKYRQVKVLETV